VDVSLNRLYYMILQVFKQGARPLAAALLLLPFLLNAQKNIPDTILLKTVVIQPGNVGLKSPVPHTDVSAAQIARVLQAQDVPMLLSGVPSLVESSDGGTGIGYTGMRIRGSDATRVNVTLNGIPLNDAESQGVYWVDVPDLAASAANIQVQRGLGMSTNGAGAFGATVNFDLSKVSADPFGIVTGSTGSFGAHKQSVYVGTGLLGGKVAFTGRLSSVHSDGYIDRARADLQSSHFSGAYIDAKQSLQVHLLSGHEITYQAWDGVPVTYIDDPKLRTYNEAGTEQPGAPYANQVDDYTQRHLLVQYKRLLRRGLDLQLNGHFTRGYGYYEEYKAAQPFAAYSIPVWSLPDTTISQTDLVRKLWLDNRFYGSNFILRWAPPVNPAFLASPPAVMLGGAWSRYDGAHYGEVTWAEVSTVPKDYQYYYNRAVKSDANVFLKAETGLSKKISAFFDLQYRVISYRFLGYDDALKSVEQTVDLHFFNPKAGFNWKFRPEWTAYGFIGMGHHEPNRDDYTQSTPSSRPRAEQLLDAESGLRTGAENWKVSANLYWMQYRNQLILDGRINDVGAYIRTNVPDSYRAGIELEGQARFWSRWTAAGHASFSRNRVRNFTEYRDNWDTGGQEAVVYHDTELAFSPSVVARGELTCQALPDSKRHALSFTWAVKHVGKQHLDNTGNEETVMPAYTYSDIRVNYDLKGVIGKQISVILSVNNVFNARYVSNGWTYRFISQGYDPRPDNPYTRYEGNSVYNQTGLFPQAGLNWMGTIRLEF
jgi:iron complex outermembrane receptor protein